MAIDRNRRRDETVQRKPPRPEIDESVEKSSDEGDKDREDPTKYPAW